MHLSTSTTERPADAGFTLVELLMTLLILGILSAVALMAVRGLHDRAGASSCAAERRTLLVALEAYQGLHNTIPTELDLVEKGLLKSESSEFDVDAAGEIVPQQDGSLHCA